MINYRDHYFLGVYLYLYGKMYCSGDLARWLPDGNIEYLGRIDDQVKIRGFRVELSEIENTIQKLKDVEDVAVITKEDKHGEKAIHAYFVAKKELEIVAMKNELHGVLPSYMIPSYMKQIENIPLTLNGKLDRKALPEITSNLSRGYVEPRTEMEKIVAESYSKVLRVTLVGRQDDFFDLGGHSLRALKLANDLEAKTGKIVEVKHIFEASEVFQLATLLEKLDVIEYERIPKAAKKPAYEMSSIQKRMYLLWKLMPTEIVYNMPVMFQFRSLINEVEIQEAFKKMAERHEILRTTFHEQERHLVQVISESLSVEVLVSKVEEGMLATWYKGAIQPFDLKVGPLYRIKIARTRKADYLFVDMHHIISDGMSSTIFVREINQLINGEELVPLELQYKDYSEWFKEQDLSESEKYWIDSLKDYPMLEIPTDFTRPKKQQFFGATEKLVLDEDVTKQIKQLIRAYNVTEYMFFLGLISVLLAKISNQEEMVIGSPVSGRVHKDTERMLGMLVNTLAMRVVPSRDKSFTDYLVELKEQTLTAQKHQAYPFEDLVEQVVENRDLSRHPLFDVMMVYQNNEDIKSLLGVEEWQLVDELSEDVAKIDMSFTLSDDGKQTYLSLNYATSLFKAEMIKTSVLDKLEVILCDILNNPEKKISEIETMTEQEKMLILSGFSNSSSI